MILKRFERNVYPIRKLALNVTFIQSENSSSFRREFSSLFIDEK